MSLLLRLCPSIAAASSRPCAGGDASPRRSAMAEGARSVQWRRPRRRVGWRVQLSRRALTPVVRASGDATPTTAAEVTADVVFAKTFPIRNSRMVEGKVSVRVQPATEGWKECLIVIGCDIEGKWVLHWGITYQGQKGREWDQPPQELRPPGSLLIKNYAVETPLKLSTNSEGLKRSEVQIKFPCDTTIATFNFVLKDEDTGSWLQHKGRDFRVSLKEFTLDKNMLEGASGISILPGSFEQLPSLLKKDEGSGSGVCEITPGVNSMEDRKYYEEYTVQKEEVFQSLLSVTVKKSKEMGKAIVVFDTNIPGQVIVHWGVYKDNSENWEIPPPPHPPSTEVFRQKALQTLLEPKADGHGNTGLFSVSTEYSTLSFVLKLNEYTWLRNMENGTDFHIPLTSASTYAVTTQDKNNLRTGENIKLESSHLKDAGEIDDVCYMEDIINEIRNLVTDISFQKGKGSDFKEAQRSILQEIEKLASEAYNIFRNSIAPSAAELPSITDLVDSKGVCSGTGSGHEILCQGFNWESHKSGRWYLDLIPKAQELASLGFSIIWLPPPTESVSPEGYLPKDLYNLNSRYGNMEELKITVKTFHEAGIMVLGDVVLNHRCAHYQNQNGIWNLFGGKLNWDDRAIVADDPHFQGRGNKSSGDNFHAAPNIDHSQDFVRKDLIEWLGWLRKEVGYDGWRLDFVRGFWGGYVKDYLEASSPHFAVGEYWDSLSYTYGEMDYNQDEHRQRIIDWINDTEGTAGAFDVTTKGILHTALGKCEYWRLSDEKGHPPGVVGWWPSRAVTFIENHDTGSTQGHWRFPSGKEMQGYAYILTHPGTPAVFYDHIFSHYQGGIKALIDVRRRLGIHCRSIVKIIKAEREVYAAEIDGKLVMKIGPGHYEPPHRPDGGHWKLATEGHDYKVWAAS